MQLSSRTQKKEKSPLCSKMMCVLSKKGLKKTPSADDEYQPSVHSAFLAFLQLILAIICFCFVIYATFYGPDEKCGFTENPVSVFVNATDSVLFGDLPNKGGEINNATTSLAKMPKVSITIDYANTKTSSGLGPTFVQMYVMASSCILLGLSLVVMEGGRLLAVFSKKQSKYYTAFVDGGVYREICLDMGDVDEGKEKFAPKY